MWHLVRGNILEFLGMFKDTHVWLQITLGNQGSFYCTPIIFWGVRYPYKSWPSNLMVFNLNLLFDFSGKPVIGTAS